MRDLPGKQRAVTAFLAFFLLNSAGLFAANRPVLTSVRQIKQLPNAVAAQGYPVQIRGVVTYNEKGGDVLSLQDNTGGIFIETHGQSLPVVPGDLVEVSGITISEGFAPAIGKPTVRIIGKSALPRPVEFGFRDLASGAKDGLLTTLSGIVRSAAARGGVAALQLDAGDAIVNVFYPHPPSFPIQTLIDAKLTLHVVCSNLYNEHNQLTGVEFYLPGWHQVKVEERPAAEPLLAPVFPVSSLMQFSNFGNSKHRVHVRGVVTYVGHDHMLYIWDGTGGIQVYRDDDREIRVGDWVDLIGFPEAGSYTPRLTNASVLRRSTAREARPMLITPEIPAIGKYDARLISLDAKVEQNRSKADLPMLYLNAGNTYFVATLPDRSSAQALNVAEDSIVRVTGICAIEVDDQKQPRSFRILLRSASDVRVLHAAPWWTLKRALLVIAALALASLLGLGWTLSLRKRVREQTECIRQAAESADRAKSEFLANVSHEIRTPMNGIIGMTELALSTELSDDQRDYLQAVKSSAESLLGLINDILDFSKIEAGRLECDPVPFALRSLISDTAKILWPRAVAKGLNLTWTISDDISDSLIGDSGKLRQIILNLAGNAVKFTDAGAVSVEVKTLSRTADSFELQFSVIDSGIGIPPEKIGSLFSPFTQADASISRRYGGTGLGLAISRRLAEVLGGRLWVESEPGVGSRFHFTASFKLDQVTASIVSQGAARLVDNQESFSPSDVGPAVKSLQILLAEDNLINQKLAVRLLEKQGHVVRIAGNGREVLAMLDDCSWSPDLILMDIQMPEMDGFETTRQIRERERSGGRRLPVIAMTAHAMTGYRERCLDAGMDGYVSKPIRMADLEREMAFHVPPPNRTLLCA